MTEIQYQAKIIKALEARGFYVIRLTKTNKNGIPDVVALKYCQEPIFIEVKGVKGIIAPLQHYRKDEIVDKGFVHYFTYAGDDFIKQVIPLL
tara:strand:- start:840 stop:1115 length:276 start_codon:yes stop_codon:yes gene_type:complete